jgi:hypothetical protein
MKLTTTFLALFAAVAASTFSIQVDARVGGDRDLNSNDDYIVYFANSCNSKVGVTSRGHSEVISPNSCQVFIGGKNIVILSLTKKVVAVKREAKHLAKISVLLITTNVIC